MLHDGNARITDCVLKLGHGRIINFAQGHKGFGDRRDRELVQQDAISDPLLEASTRTLRRLSRIFHGALTSEANFGSRLEAEASCALGHVGYGNGKVVWGRCTAGIMRLR